ncbi:cytochrome P450 2W1-like [Dendropsophus ebraccatus]|uniref:cytochrome P450 2W1-like n=1 Tax=Dendropsophus ebraccatus TaxID=150705 RepID=UPI0038316447
MAAELVTLFLLCTLIMMTMKILMSFSRRKIYNFPPGPTPLPIIGNLHILDINRQDFTFMELAKKYGPMFTFHFGSAKAVVLVGYEANKEILTTAKYEFGNRGAYRIVDDFQQNHGVFLANGESWKVLRRFMLSILRDFGMGKKPIEGRIIEELQFLNAEIRSYNGKPFDKKVFYLPAPNIIYGIIFGRRFNYDNPTFQKIITIMDDVVVNTSTTAAKVYNIFPIFKHFVKEPGLVMDRVEELNKILKGLFKEAKEVKSQDSFRTFTEAFLQKDDREIVTDEEEKIFTEKNFLASTFDLMLGGTETTSTTIQWAMLLMMKYPHIQKKVQDEIENVIGLERPPSWEDQKVLPYCLAVVHEVQRFGNILQYLPHSTSADVHFHDYFIPKGTTVIPLFSSIHYDETQWETPKEFNPNHFLDADGNFMKKDAFYPFSKDSISINLILSTLLILIFLVHVITRSKKSPYNFPPGPTPLPLIGNLHLLDFKRQDLSLLKLSEKYGPIFTIHLGMNKAIVLTGLETIKEALVERADIFSDRGFFPIFRDIQKGNGVFFSSGEIWRTTRRFTASSLRNLGMGKKHIEEKIIEELQFLSDKIESFAGQPFKLREFTCGPTNITLAMLFGNRFDYKDPMYMQLLDLIHHTFILLGSLSIQFYNMYPMLSIFLKTPRIVLEKLDQINKMIKRDMQAKRKKMDVNCLSSFIEALVCKQEEERTNKDSFFHDDNMLATVLDLVMAGTETTSTTLHWGILLLAKYPEVQKKVQKEINLVLGSGRLPRYEDRNAMPYAHAVVHEIQRFANVIPHLAHATATDTNFRGYHIPKGTTVIPLLTSVLYDKRHWETPFQFNPNHFLDKDGRFVKNEAFMPFSTGRRLCVGESLVKMELFIFITGLLQKFTLTPPHGMTECDLDLDAVQCFTLRPQLHLECCAVVK